MLKIYSLSRPVTECTNEHFVIENRKTGKILSETISLSIDLKIYDRNQMKQARQSSERQRKQKTEIKKAK